MVSVFVIGADDLPGLLPLLETLPALEVIFGLGFLDITLFGFSATSSAT